jgi:hypothetical protein
MATTYTLISSVTVGSGGAATIGFTSIPATYTDLLIKLSGRSTSGGNTSDVVNLTINGQSAASTRYLLGNGSSASSSVDVSNVYGGGNTGSSATASTFSNCEIYIPNYTSTGIKPMSIDIVTENNATASWCLFVAGSITNSAAISSITFTPDATNFAQYSTAYIYGISNA